MLAGSRDLRRTENIWGRQNRDIAITSCSEDKTSSALPGYPHHTAYHMKSQILSHYGALPSYGRTGPVSQRLGRLASGLAGPALDGWHGDAAATAARESLV
jgi:hypothetical protein